MSWSQRGRVGVEGACQSRGGGSLYLIQHMCAFAKGRCNHSYRISVWF